MFDYLYISWIQLCALQKKYLIFVWRFYFPPASNWYKREESRFYILVNVWKSPLNAMNNTTLTAAISYVFLEIEISSNTTNISSENYILRFLDPYVSNPDLSPWVTWIYINKVTVRLSVCVSNFFHEYVPNWKKFIMYHVSFHLWVTTICYFIVSLCLS